MSRINKAFVETTNETGVYGDVDLRGFFLRVRDKSKVFIARAKQRGTRNSVLVTIGPYPVFSAEQARAKARIILHQLATGINPNQERRDARDAEEAKVKEEAGIKRLMSVTLQQALNDYIRVRDLKESTRYIYRLSIEHYLDDWLELPLVEISKEMVEQRHVKLSESKAQANQTMRVLRAIYSYATIAYEGEDGKPIITDNPVRRLSQLRVWNRIPRRQTVVKAHQLSRWYSAVSGIPDDVARDYLLLLLLTGLRKTEAASLTWNNVDLQGKTMTLIDTKNHQDHMLPLSDALYDLLMRRWASRKNDYVFPGRGDKSTTYLKDYRLYVEMVIKESGATFTLHDLRRTFLTTAEQIDIPYYALKRLVNHKLSADVTSGYIVADVERLREPMQKITNELLERCGVKRATPAKVRSASKSARKA